MREGCNLTGTLQTVVFPDFHLSLNCDSSGTGSGFGFDISLSVFYMNHNTLIACNKSIGKIKNFSFWMCVGSAVDIEIDLRF